MIQPTGKTTGNAASSIIKKPSPYSSIVYLINEVTIFCFGVLIDPKHFLSDGSCGQEIITHNQVSYIITNIGTYQ